MKLGEPLAKRRETLAALGAQERLGYENVEYKGQRAPLAVYSIRIDVPRYRLRNGRTIAAQRDLLARKPALSANLFDDLESDLAQSHQHAILHEMAEGTPLAKEMEKGRQTEALILNADGIVINGNRRLALMREFLDKKGATYSAFQYIRVAILESTDERDIYEYEVKEQIKPEVKARYDWIQTAMMIKRGMDEFGMTDDQLAKTHDLPKKELQRHLDLLQAADEYLEDRGHPSEYHLVENEMHAFEKISKGRQALGQEDKKQAFTEISYALMEEAPKGIGRLYDAIPRVQENLDDIIARVEEEVDLPEVAAGPADADADLLGAATAGSMAHRLALALQDPARKQEVVAVVVDAIQAAQSQATSTHRQAETVRKIRAANTALSEARMAFGPGSKRDGIEEQLRSIEANVKAIREQMAKHA